MNDKQYSIEMNVDIDELWDAVWGSEGMGVTYWADSVRTIDRKGISLWKKDTYEPNPQDFSIHDCEEDTWHDITLDRLVEAYGMAQAQGLKHCGNFSLDLEDPDACFADVILQLAAFDEVIYG
jgi:hypothetical protein